MAFQIGIKLDTGKSLNFLRERDPASITQRMLDEVTEQAAWDYVTLLRKFTPVSKGPESSFEGHAAGTLWRSWYVRRTGQAKFNVGNNAKSVLGVPYLVFVMQGHGPIVPHRDNGVLRFWIWNAGSGKLMFRRYVKPFPPNAFVQKALEAWNSQGLGRATLNAAGRKIAPWWQGKITNPYTQVKKP